MSSSIHTAAIPMYTVHLDTSILFTANKGYVFEHLYDACSSLQLVLRTLNSIT